MKYFSLILIFVTYISFGQSLYQLEHNNVRAVVSDGGAFFENTNTAGYEIPIGSGQTAIYSMGFWMAGQDTSGQLHSSFSNYLIESELFPGPISDDYGSSYYSSTFLTSLWVVSKAEIDYHIANYTNQAYVTPNSILDWPGDGNTSEGVAANLAPYVDVNANGTYDPANGDYPFIEGDKAVYVIMNDENGTHAITPGQALGVEVHVMFYQFVSSDDLNNTTFFHVNVFNRRSETYGNFKFGIFADCDLGNYVDDFWGSDSAKNYMFTYNGDNMDENNAGIVGYGSAPPAIGIVSLSQPLDAAIGYSDIQAPSTANDYYNTLLGMQQSGAAYVHPDGYDTKFLFSENPDSSGWNEPFYSSVPGDRRGVMSLSESNLAPGDNLCADFAIVYHRNQSLDNIENAQALDGVVDFVQNYFDNNIQPCSSIAVGMNENTGQNVAVEIYPNPTTGNVTLEVDKSGTLEIFDASGKLLETKLLVEGVNSLSFNYTPGIYVLKIKTDNGFTTRKLNIR
ncbi:MAG: T9SS type A sorting domain-containing protein [Crocinitomicaceae bacterium]|nr:T9SS type A sorting domain-containing protein [Crocinitomicaceae bacterium]